MQVTSMAAAFEEIQELEKGVSDTNETISLVYGAISSNIAKATENEEEIRKVYEPRLVYLTKRIQEKVMGIF